MSQDDVLSRRMAAAIAVAAATTTLAVGVTVAAIGGWLGAASGSAPVENPAEVLPVEPVAPAQAPVVPAVEPAVGEPAVVPGDDDEVVAYWRDNDHDEDFDDDDEGFDDDEHERHERHERHEGHEGHEDDDD